MAFVKNPLRLKISSTMFLFSESAKIGNNSTVVKTVRMALPALSSPNLLGTFE
jgi:hypothetical protein